MKLDPSFVRSSLADLEAAIILCETVLIIRLYIGGVR